MKAQAKKTGRVIGNEKGFTLIEIIIVIVILGIMAVVAIPKYVDLKTEAKISAADGVFGAAQGAAAINFAKGLTDQAGHTAIAVGTGLLATLDGTPDGWIAGTTDTAEICFDDNSDSDCTAADTYIITVATAETDTAKAELTKNW